MITLAHLFSKSTEYIDKILCVGYDRNIEKYLCEEVDNERDLVIHSESDIGNEVAP